MADARRNSGLAYGVAAYGLWGVMPLYFWAVRSVPPIELLAHRIVLSAILLAIVLTLLGRWRLLLDGLRARRTRYLLLTSSVLVAVNWYVYIYGVSTNQVVETSLGYFINPLFSILLGLVFFRERLRPGQWAAVALAAAGLLWLVQAAGQIPWIALTLAVSFGFYGLVRKLTPVDALTGLTVETIVLAPLALGALVLWTVMGSLGYRGGDGVVNVLLVLSGVVTTVPLLCFGQAALRLPLSVLGFLQYLAPSLQLFIGVAVFEQSFPLEKQIGFGFIWTALALLTAESALAHWRRPLNPAEAEVPVAVPE